MSAHPLHLPYRADQALQTLDTLLAALRLPALDAAHPDRSLRTDTGIPIIARPPGYSYPQTCSCTPRTDTPADMDGFPAEAPCGPPHDDNDEARRLVWVALMLATHHSVGCASTDREPLDLRLFDVDRVSIYCPPVLALGADKCLVSVAVASGTRCWCRQRRGASLSCNVTVEQYHGSAYGWGRAGTTRGYNDAGDA